MEKKSTLSHRRQYDLAAERIAEEAFRKPSKNLLRRMMLYFFTF